MKACELVAFFWNTYFPTVDQLLYCVKQDLDFSALELVFRVASDLFPFIAELQNISDTSPTNEWAEHASLSNRNILDFRE
jgi:hypothetical protein